MKYQFKGRKGRWKTRWISTDWQACLDEECDLVLRIDGPSAGGLCMHQLLP